MNTALSSIATSAGGSSESPQVKLIAKLIKKLSHLFRVVYKTFNNDLNSHIFSFFLGFVCF